MESTMNHHQWQDLLYQEWIVSRIFSFLSVRDLRSIHAVNSSLQCSIDSFLNSLPGNFASNLGHNDALSSNEVNSRPLNLVLSFLSLDGLKALNQVSRGCRFSIRLYSTRLPRKVRRIMSTWCQEKGFAFLMHSFECSDRRPGSDRILFLPPLLKLSLGQVTYDKESGKLIGQPLQEVQIDGLPSLGLGRTKPFTCETDEPGVIFYCGGEQYFNEMRDNVWSWISREHLISGHSTTTALFDTKKGTWRTLPSMPEGQSGGAATRIGKRIYTFSGRQPIGRLYPGGRNTKFVMVFDLEQEQWIDDPGIEPFPGGRYGDECDQVTSFGTDIVIVCGQEVFRLNTCSGQWTEMPRLPMKVGDIQTCRIVKHLSLNVPMLIVFGKKTWAQITLSSVRPTEFYGQDRLWDITPDLRGYDLKVARLHKGEIHLFSGDSWTLVKSQNNTSFYGGLAILSSTLNVVGHSQQ